MRRAHDDDARSAAAAQAIERVLMAERDAEARIADAQRRAQALLDAARDDARAAVERAEARSAQRRQRHAGALERRLAALRTAAVAAEPAPGDDAALTRAIERVAARMTTPPAPTPGRDSP